MKTLTLNEDYTRKDVHNIFDPDHLHNVCRHVGNIWDYTSSQQAR